MDHIKALFAVVDHNLATINGTMDYGRITDAIIALANAVHAVQPDDENIDWEMGEFGAFCLIDLIVGAFWHYAEWHGWQSSKGYAALIALGQVYNPGMTTPELDNEAYILLEELAEGE